MGWGRRLGVEYMDVVPDGDPSASMSNKVANIVRTIERHQE